MFGKKKEIIICEDCTYRGECVFRQAGGAKTACAQYVKDICRKSCWHCKYGKFDGLYESFGHGKCACLSKRIYASDCCTEYEERGEK